MKQIIHYSTDWVVQRHSFILTPAYLWSRF